ncbi:polymerase delta-interacting protein 3 [Saguinus oedipus]|uniref:Polymerase delta-interacting protein 3 n=1 Tax=Saguinus oedipus TaxID=9490 RepID=A0ABQ9VN55_SAGOE|nr:polymerase delta-interacting protein 3 [Saguinus oedipus]
MADISLIRNGEAVQGLLSQSARIATFQQRSDAQQKIGLSDARLKLGVKDVQEKLLQKDARFRIKGKVQDAREMLNSRKQQTMVPQKSRQVADAREKISLKRSSRAVFMNPPIGTVTPALKLTKTIQVPQQKAMAPLHLHPAGMRINVVNNRQAKKNLYDLDEKDDGIASIPTKQMKFAASGGFPHDMAGLSSSKLSMSKALPILTKVVQNGAYTAPALPSSIRTKALTNMSRTLVNKGESPKELPPAEPVLSPLEGTKMTVNNLHPRVTKEDIVELFCVCGALKRAQLPMKCNLHMNGNVITSDQPILLRLSDSPSVKKESELPRRVNTASSSNPLPKWTLTPS